VRDWPQRWVHVTRNGRIAFVGYIAETVPQGERLHVTAYTPEKLVVDAREPPFPVPMAEYVVQPSAYEFWWKQLDYVFGLGDPRGVPPLATTLAAPESNVVNRYVRIAGDLAGSSLINASDEGFHVRVPDDGVHEPDEVDKRFGGRDVLAGFAALLRQCDSPNDRAHFERVRSILWVASQAAPDPWQEARLRELTAWSAAAKALHRKSLNQLLRDKLVTQGVGAVQYDEEHSPVELLTVYNYGDLIHWGDRSGVVAEWEEDDYVESDRRLAYLHAAAALAHVYIGFAELARTATGVGAVALGRA
jgi:hypothetical protein